MSPNKSKIELLRQYFEIGIGLLGSTAFSVLKIPRLIEIYQNNRFEGILSITLFIVTLAYIGGWIYFDLQEIQYIDENIDTEKVKIKSEPFMAAIFIGIAGGLLIGFIDKPRYYLLVEIFLILAGLIGTRVLRKKINLYYQNNDPKVTDIGRIIIDYYTKLPFNKLDLSIILFCIIGLLFSWSAFKGNRIPFIGYIISIIAVAVHEGAMWIWRFKRTRQIELIENLTT